jgi:copper(I)-binding protein
MRIKKIERRGERMGRRSKDLAPTVEADCDASRRTCAGYNAALMRGHPGSRKESSMKPKRSFFVLAVAVAAASVIPAVAQVTVTDAWVRGTVAGQKTTGAFMQLKSATDTTLVDVSSPAAKIVEIHEMKIADGVMKMIAVDRLPLPAGRAVELKPGGYHVMLMGLAQPLKEGDTVPLKLTLEDKAGKKTTVEIKAPVKALTAGAMTPAPKQ